VSFSLQIFVCSLSLKTCITNFINLDVSRVMGFPEFPNRAFVQELPARRLIVFEPEGR
jgi:hypothetical protein